MINIREASSLFCKKNCLYSPNSFEIKHVVNCPMNPIKEKIDDVIIDKAIKEIDIAAIRERLQRLKNKPKRRPLQDKKRRYLTSRDRYFWNELY